MADIADMAQAREEAHRARAILAARRMMHAGDQETDADGHVICADCGERIPAARLRVLPRAVRCVECQAKIERSAARAGASRLMRERPSGSVDDGY